MSTHFDRLSIALTIAVALSACGPTSEPPPQTAPPPPAAGTDEVASTAIEPNAVGQRIIPVLDRGEDVALGGRFDTLTGEIIGASSCLQGGEPVDRGSSGSDIRLVEVTDTYSQMKALDIDVSVQGSYLGASGNAKAKFVQDQSFSQSSQNFLVYASAQRIPRTLDPHSDRVLFELTEVARNAIGDPADYNKFRKICGDAFIKAINEGVALFGMLTFENQTQTQKKETSGSMGASYGGWSASVAASNKVTTASESGSLSINVSTDGNCPGAAASGTDAASRWASITTAAVNLSECAETGANPMSFKVVPYSSQFVRDWPFDETSDPKLDELLYVHAAYGAILDTINPLLVDRAGAYKKALLNRGINFEKLDQLATTIRRERSELLALRKACQSNAAPDERTGCGDDQTLSGTLAKYTSPYVYRAQLPLSFVDGRPIEAFMGDDQIKQEIMTRNVQYPRDVACAQSDASGSTSLPGCPDDFDAIRQAAEQVIVVHGPTHSRDGHYVFQTQSTGRNFCLVAPTTEKITMAAQCDLKTPSASQQRFHWESNGLVGIRSKQCLGGARKAVTCDDARPEQLWRFVPTHDNPAVGRIQNGAGKCLVHANTDRNVRLAGCNEQATDESAKLWKPIKVE